MRTRNGLLAPAALPLLWGGCVSVGEAPMTAGAIQSGQRAVVLVFPSPGPVILETDSKVEGAAKIVPGLGLLVGAAQDERDLQASRDLQQYLPPWNAAERFQPVLMKELGASGYPGPLVPAAEAGLDAAALADFNKAKDVVEWRGRYVLPSYEPTIPRNYSKRLDLDDALVLEVNLTWGVDTDGEGNAAPSLRALTRLVRANNAKELWRHEDEAVDKSAQKILYDYKVKPEDLIAQWEALLPQAAARIAAEFGKSLSLARTVAVPAGTAQ